MLILNDCLIALKEMADNSIDAICTDPPYGLSFMGKKWDYDVPSTDIWKECLRVLKPGGHLLAFFGTRTYHRGVVKIEDAGFEIRDQIMWIYGSGFPKSHNIDKAIDKQKGLEPIVVGDSPNNRPSKRHGAAGFDSEEEIGSQNKADLKITKPNSKEAKQWQGWGTALKPANEPIVLARKPLEKGLTIAENVLKWGTGAINVDGCRIGINGATKKINTDNCRDSLGKYGDGLNGGTVSNLDGVGRWPANIILDEQAAQVLDEQTKNLHGAGAKRSGGLAKQNQDGGIFGVGQHEGNGMRFGDSGGASRFFKVVTQELGPTRFLYQAKASKSERNKGLEGMPLVESGIKNDSGRGFSESDPHKKILNQNHHPTVKPIKLMEYLCKLITPPNGTILDPFMGSGSTGVSAKNLGFKFVGIERDEQYFEIAKKRINQGEEDEERIT